MAMRTCRSIRLSPLALGAALALSSPALAGDVSVKLAEDSGFVVHDSTGAIERLRVDEDTGDVSRNGELFLHSPGTDNLFFGADAGYSATPECSGNTGVGDRALFSITSGSGNAALGDGALLQTTTGSRNVAIGQNAGENQTTGSNNIYLANPGLPADQARIRIGTSPTHTEAFIAGINGTNIGGTGLPVYVSSTGQLGTGVALQAPWTSDIDAANFDLTNLRRLEFGSDLVTADGFDIEFPAESGYGFRISSAEGPLSGGIGIARDTIATIGFNWNDGGVNHGTPFNPSWGLSFESNFPTVGWPYDTVQEFHIISQVGRTSGTVVNGTGFAADQVVVVEEPGNGATVGVGILKSIGPGPGATVVIDWIYSENADTNPPSSGDTLERESSTTVTNRTGNFVMSGGGLWVYPSATCGPDGSTSTAILGLSSIANQVGMAADLVFVRSFGAGTDVVPGNCVRQATTNATALLGPISIPAATVITSNLAATNDGAWRPMTSIYSPHLQAMNSSWFGNRTLMETGVPTMRIGTLDPGQTSHWFTIASRKTGPGGNDYVGAIGDETDDQNYAIWGRWWIFEPGGVDHVSLGAASITGTKTQELADLNGTVAVFTDLTGCAAGVPVVASGSTGGIKCEPPGFASASIGERGVATAPVFVVQPIAFGSEQDQTLPSGSTAPPENLRSPDTLAEAFPHRVAYDEAGQPFTVVSNEMASLLWNEMQQQQETIEEQAREIEALRQEHEAEVSALTKRLARIEARVLGAPGKTRR